MPRLDEDSVSRWLGADPAADAAVSPQAVLPAERDPAVVMAIEALGTDLDDAFSRDPDGFFQNLRTDAARIALFQLLAGLGSSRVTRVLDWIIEISPQGQPQLFEHLGDQDTAERLRRANRRSLFDRILAPGRLADLLSVCTDETQQEAA